MPRAAAGPAWGLSVWAAPGIPGGSSPLAALPAKHQPDYSPRRMPRAARLHFPGFSARGVQDCACAGPGGGAGPGRGRRASRERGKSVSLRCGRSMSLDRELRREFPGRAP